MIGNKENVPARSQSAAGKTDYEAEKSPAPFTRGGKLNRSFKKNDKYFEFKKYLDFYGAVNTPWKENALTGTTQTMTNTNDF